MNTQILIFAALAAGFVGILGYAFLFKRIETEKKTGARLDSLKRDPREKKQAQTKKVDEKQRRKAREEQLKSLEQRTEAGKNAANPNLADRLKQADIKMSARSFIIMSAFICLVSGAIYWLILGLPLLLAAGKGFVSGVAIPRFIVRRKREKRFKAFTKAFPDAVDIIVRGVRSGLPLNDCLRIIANDAEEPVRSEFRKLVESTQMGLSVPEASERLYESIPTSETNFFSIVLTIQSQAGGNLSEALGNLVRVLRERAKMADKIKAVSQEAKTSAIIIGSLPFVVAGLVSFTKPSYLVPLYSTSGGHKTLIFCAISMGMGIMIMRKMINFKF